MESLKRRAHDGLEKRFAGEDAARTHSTFEMYSYSRSTTTRDKTVRADSLCDWAMESLPNDQLGEQPAGGLKMVLVPVIKSHNPEMLSLSGLGISQKLFDQVFDVFGIDKALPYLMMSNPGDHLYAFEPSYNDRRQLVFSYYLQIRDYYMLAWSHNVATSTTKGFSFAKSQSYNWFRSDIAKEHALLDQPLLPALVSAFGLLEKTPMSRHIDMLKDVERLTGYHVWESPEYSFRILNPGDDYAQMTRVMSGTATKLAQHQRHLQVVSQICPFVIKNEAKYLKQVSIHRRADQKKKVDEMRGCVSILRECIASQSSLASYFEQRVKIQLQGVRIKSSRTHVIMLTKAKLFNLIAKEDADLNIDLAKDQKTIALASKRDSSSMKTIAIMTMAFLPGTFFAALFATPLLKWDSSPVMQNKFWVFWAFTVPSTLLILIIWFAFTRRETSIRQGEDSKARNTIGLRPHAPTEGEESRNEGSSSRKRPLFFAKPVELRDFNAA